MNENNGGQTEPLRVFRTLLNGDDSQGGVRWKARRTPSACARYTKEFKIEASRLLQLGQKPATELALELGVRRNQLYKWAEELSRKDGDESLAFNGPSGRPPADQLSEIERLKRELKKVSEERDILKKAAAYFAKELP